MRRSSSPWWGETLRQSALADSSAEQPQETRRPAAILVADLVGYSRLTGADEDRTLARLRCLRSDLIDPAIDARHGRIIKPTGVLRALLRSPH
jgi:class 3 adenylate cyclase